MLDPHVHGADVLLRHLPEPLDAPLTGVEVGVLRGINANRLLQAKPQLLLHLVDNWNVGDLVTDSPSQIRTQARRRLKWAEDRIVWHECRSLRAAGRFSHRSLDFVYLDSNHEFNHLKTEIHYWAKAIKEGGILAGHDYGHPDYPGVALAVDARIGQEKLVVEERTWLVRL